MQCTEVYCSPLKCTDVNLFLSFSPKMLFFLYVSSHDYLSFDFITGFSMIAEKNT